MNDIETAAYYASQAVYDQPEYHQLLLDLGYIKDPTLSTYNTSTYYNNDHALVAYRGTTAPEDLSADKSIALGTHRSHTSFKLASNVAKKAKQKYNKVYTTGHSLGGTKAIESANDIGSHAIAFNPGTGLLKLKTGAHKVFRKKQDLISARLTGSNITTTDASETSLGHSLTEFDSQFRNKSQKPKRPAKRNRSTRSRRFI